VQGWLLLDVVVRKCSAILKLFSCKDESLLIGGDTFLILDLGLDVFNGVWWFNVEGDGLSCECFHEDLHSTSESEDQVEGWFFLDVVVGKSSSVFKLFSSEDESLLIGRDSFLILDLGLDILNGVWWLNVKSDGLSSQSFDEDLHTSSQSEDQVKSGFFLNIVVR